MVQSLQIGRYQNRIVRYVSVSTSVLIQKFESLQIRIAAPELCWTEKGISDGSSDGGTGSQRGGAGEVE
ncbi:MAG TPA: hypothetical protein VK635_25120, partial [Bradyrhizobium sp.]|nr:hypothetical protein [Bradyrhizobium sp.]